MTEQSIVASDVPVLAWYTSTRTAWKMAQLTFEVDVPELDLVWVCNTADYGKVEAYGWVRTDNKVEPGILFLGPGHRHSDADLQSPPYLEWGQCVGVRLGGAS